MNEVRVSHIELLEPVKHNIMGRVYTRNRIDMPLFDSLKRSINPSSFSLPGRLVIHLDLCLKGRPLLVNLFLNLFLLAIIAFILRFQPLFALFLNAVKEFLHPN